MRVPKKTYYRDDFRQDVTDRNRHAIPEQFEFSSDVLVGLYEDEYCMWSYALRVIPQHLRYDYVREIFHMHQRAIRKFLEEDRFQEQTDAMELIANLDAFGAVPFYQQVEELNVHRNVFNGRGQLGGYVDKMREIFVEEIAQNNANDYDPSHLDLRWFPHYLLYFLCEARNGGAGNLEEHDLLVRETMDMTLHFIALGEDETV